MIKSIMIVVVVLACLVAGFAGGCNPVSVGALTLDTLREALQGHNAGEGVIDTKLEREMRASLIHDIQARQAQDDLDYIWLLDRNSYMSQWHAAVGR